MKNLSNLIPKTITAILLTIVYAGSIADTILVEQPRGSIIKLTQKGKPACGTVNWGSIRQTGTVTIDGQTITMGEPKLPLSKAQWELLLSKIAGDKKEVTIAHAWEKGPAGLAAALRVAYDIRSHGGTAWVLNGDIGHYKSEADCTGEYHFKGKPMQVYMSEEQFWNEIKHGQFLDARGRGATAPPNYTWVVGSPKQAKAIDIASFTYKGKVDKDAYSCDAFKNVSVAGCDSVHKTFLAVEAARYANCDTQPKIMPFWGLAGASRHSKIAKKVWGDHLTLNSKRTGEIAQ